MAGERQGSSPLARGTHAGAATRRSPLGLIPARAGNTRGHVGGSALAGAHPRSRGEHLGVVTSKRGMEGSSPLARGTLSPK